MPRQLNPNSDFGEHARPLWSDAGKFAGPMLERRVQENAP